MRRLPQDNSAIALTTHQLQVERRERVIEPIKWMGIIGGYEWWGPVVVFVQDTGVTPLLFTRSAMGFFNDHESQDLGLTSHPKTDNLTLGLHPDSRTLVYKWNTKLALIWKEDFGPLGNSPVLLLLSPGKPPLTTTVAKFIDSSVCGGSWCLDPSLGPFLWSSPKFFNRFCLTIPIRLRFSLLVEHLFLPHFFLPLNFLLTCLDTALCEHPASLAMNVCGLPSLWRVSMIVFWTTVRSAVFPMIV